MNNYDLSHPRFIDGVDRRITIADGILHCECGASARNTSTERNRFLRRHPKLCSERAAFAHQLAQGVRIVEDEERREEREGREKGEAGRVSMI